MNSILRLVRRVTVGWMPWLGFVLAVTVMTCAMAPTARAAERPTIKSAFPRVSTGEEGTVTDSKAGLTIDQVLVVELSGYQDWRAEGTNADHRLSLYLDRIELRGVEVPTEPDEQVEFVLDRKGGATQDDRDKNKDAWNRLLRMPTWVPRSLRVAVGPEGGLPFKPFSRSADVSVKFHQIWTPGLILFFVSFGVLLYGIVRLGRESDLLRDRVECLPEGARAPFSLARCQMAFWLFLAVMAFLFLYLVTLETESVNGSVLALLGISAGTGFASKLVDLNPEPEAVRTAKARIAEIDRELAAATPPAAEVRTRLEAERKSLSEKLTAVTRPRRQSQGFWLDVLSDSAGVTVYRLQMAVWTVALGFVFGWEVYRTLSMPTLPSELLALMGLSGGTYVGFKAAGEGAAKQAGSPSPTPGTGVAH